MNIDFFAVGIIASVLLYGFALMMKNWSLTSFVGILFIIISVLAIAYPLTTSQIVLAGSTQIQNKLNIVCDHSFHTSLVGSWLFGDSMAADESEIRQYA